jgi:hypothetical protein
MFALGLRFPAGVSSRLLRVSVADEEAASALESRLLAVSGVVEARVIAGEATAYLKVDRRRLDQAALDAISAGAA